MRQAGRYMPEYRKLRERHTLWQMFHEPEIAAQVSLLPIDLLDVDAAIMFSDILVIAEAFGLQVHFPEKGGPFIEPALSSAADVDALHLQSVPEKLAYVKETIALLKPQLKVPLIGFCGGPFTVATYMIARGKKEATLEWLTKDPDSFHRLLEKLTEASLAYLRLQIAAGAQVQTFCLPYLRQLVDGLKATHVPVILFCRDSSLYPQELSMLQPTAISFDWQRTMAELRPLVPSTIAIQGNFDPELLKGSFADVKAGVEALLASMHGQKGWIFNLGHGVLPDTPFANVQCLVETILSQ
jgi:uroporphyrinogen decarboxylase